MESRKYERTYHLPYSPGTTSDDKVQMDYWHRQLSEHVLKYVRKDHVQTSQHWTRNWRPARLINHD